MADSTERRGVARRVGGSLRPRPIALYLFVLALVALVPAFIFTAVLLERHNQAQERVVETLIVGTSRSIVQAIEREIVANITTLRVLATSPALEIADFRSFHDRVRHALAGTSANVYLMNADLETVMSTRTDYGASPGTPAADESSGRRAQQTGDIVVSDLVFGAVSERWVFNILLPVTLLDGRGMLLGLSRVAEDLSAALLSNKLPTGWNVALIDRDGTVIAASPGSANSGDHFSLAEPDNLASSSGWSTLGENFQAVVQRSPLTGWILVAWAPRQLISQPLSDALGSLLIGGVLLAATVILAIYWVSLRIGRSVHRLAADARRLGAGEAVPPRHYPITEIATVSDALVDASGRRQAAEAEVRFLMRELAHRSKNQMTVIAAMAKQTARGAETVAEFVQSFEKRIFGLARSTDLLLAHGIAGVDLRELLAHQIDPFCPVDGGRLKLEGPPLRLNTQAAQILGMAAHELSTNAVKYGAFSLESGRLEVTWTLSDDTLSFIWRETVHGLPNRPERRGFGTTVVENMVGRSLGADVARTIREDGIEWRFLIPLTALDPRAVPHEPVADVLPEETEVAEK